MPKYQSKRSYKRRPRKVFIKKTKKMVTGQGPTLLEKIASYAGPVASLAKAVIPIVSAINTEAKYFDSVQSTNTATFAVPAIFPLTNIGQGLTDITRIGNSILMKNINIHLRNVQASSILVDEVARVVLFIDKMQNGVSPTIAQLMESTATVLSRFNKDYTDRFVILHDEVIKMSPNFSGATPREDRKWFNQLDFHGRYLGTDGTQLSQGPNNVYMLFWPNTNNVADQVFGFYSRLNFTDN